MNEEARRLASAGEIETGEFMADVPDPFERGEIQRGRKRGSFEVIDRERNAQGEAESFPGVAGGNGSRDHIVCFGSAVDAGAGGVFEVGKRCIFRLPLGAFVEGDWRFATFGVNQPDVADVEAKVFGFDSGFSDADVAVSLAASERPTVYLRGEANGNGRLLRGS